MAAPVPMRMLTICCFIDISFDSSILLFFAWGLRWWFGFGVSPDWMCVVGENGSEDLGELPSVDTIAVSIEFIHIYLVGQYQRRITYRLQLPHPLEQVHHDDDGSRTKPRDTRVESSSDGKNGSIQMTPARKEL